MVATASEARARILAGPNNISGDMMLIKLRNKQELNLPEDIIASVTLGTDKKYLHSGTSYVLNLVRQMQKTKGKYLLYKPHLACLYSIVEHLSGEYSSYFEPFGGVGVTAKIFNAQQTFVNDYDPLCVRVLSGNFRPFQVSQVDMADSVERKALYRRQQGVEVVHLDYNNFTLHKFATDKPVFGKGVGYREMTTEAFACAAKFVIINDCTPTLLTKSRLNAHSNERVVSINSTRQVTTVTPRDRASGQVKRETFFGVLPFLRV
jgi:hypothetical protein